MGDKKNLLNKRILKVINPVDKPAGFRNNPARSAAGSRGLRPELVAGVFGFPGSIGSPGRPGGVYRGLPT